VIDGVVLQLKFHRNACSAGGGAGDYSARRHHDEIGGGGGADMVDVLDVAEIVRVPFERRRRYGVPMWEMLKNDLHAVDGRRTCMIPLG
jgi:hypothetical protein